MERKSGVLAPVFSLPGRFGIGTLGAGARRFVDLLAEGGFHLWQTLPLLPPDGYGSPYAAVSSFAMDPALIDPDELVAEGLLHPEEADACALPEEGGVHPASRAGREVLSAAAARAERTPVEDFLETHPETAAYCTALADRGALFSEVSFFQYEAHREWDALRSYAASRGVGIIGDLPMYPAAGSLDVALFPDAFCLNPQGEPTAVAGVPPDYFSPEGQVWGNPLYDWARAAEGGYAYHRARIAYLCRHFDGLRLDHFRGYESYFAIPGGAPAAEGHWEAGPRDDLLSALAPVLAGRPVIAEDLGEVGEDVDALRRRAGYLTTRVLPFAFLGDPQSPHLPHRCPEDCAVYSGTHDTAPLAAHLAAMPEGERRYLMDYCGAHEGEGLLPILCTLLATHAAYAIFPICDLLGLGGEARINTPGQAEGNWRFRCTEAQLDALDTDVYRYYNRLYGR